MNKELKAVSHKKRLIPSATYSKVVLLGQRISLQGWGKWSLPELTGACSHTLQFSKVLSHRPFLHDYIVILISFSGLWQVVHGKGITCSTIDMAIKHNS